MSPETLLKWRNGLGCKVFANAIGSSHGPCDEHERRTRSGGDVWLESTRARIVEGDTTGSNFMSEIPCELCALRDWIIVRFRLPGHIVQPRQDEGTASRRDSDSKDEGYADFKTAAKFGIVAHIVEGRCSLRGRANVASRADSKIIRKTVIKRLEGVRSKVEGSNWVFHEHPTVESILLVMKELEDNMRVLVTVE